MSVVIVDYDMHSSAQLLFGVDWQRFPSYNTWDSLLSGNELYCVDSANSCLFIIPSTDPTDRWNMHGSMVFQIGKIGDASSLNVWFVRLMNHCSEHTSTTRGIVHRYRNKRCILSAMRSQVYKISKPRYCK
jgi:hypothetical protein